MKKPVKKVSEPYWDYHEVIEYIEKKHKIKVRDMAGRYSTGKFREKTPHLDFWHWVCETCEVSNGKLIYLAPPDPEWPPHVNQVLTWLEEFGCDLENDQFLVSW